MSLTIHTQLTAGGIDFIEPGEIYDRACFTDDQIAVLRELWKCRMGTIGDAGPHKGKTVVQFVERKG